MHLDTNNTLRHPSRDRIAVLNLIVIRERAVVNRFRTSINSMGDFLPDVTVAVRAEAVYTVSNGVFAKDRRHEKDPDGWGTRRKAGLTKQYAE